MPTRLTAIRADLTTLAVDAIVNAANTSLMGGGGVDGAIHRAAGPGLLEECRTLGGCETGDAKITGGHNLPARFVIHTVGPVWSAEEDRSALLRDCYTNSLAVAADLGATTVAFPLISSGVYRWPREDAVRQAVAGITAAPPSTVDDVRLVLFDEETRDVAERVLQAT